MRKLIFILLMLVAKVLLLHAQQEPVQKIKITKTKGSVAVELLKMNVLYVGIDNPVNITVTNTNNFTVVMAKGTIVQNENYFIIKESSPGIDTLFIYDGKNHLIDKRLFRVKSIPKPHACIGGKCNNSSISKNALLAQKGIFAVFDNLDFELFVKVISFQMTISKSNSQTLSLESSSNLFTDEMKKLIETLDAGTKIIFEEIIAVGPDGQKMELESLELLLK